MTETKFELTPELLAEAVAEEFVANNLDGEAAGLFSIPADVLVNEIRACVLSAVLRIALEHGAPID